MKLDAPTLKGLVAVLNAQAGIKRMPLADYKTALAQVKDLLNSSDGAYTGGIKPEVYKDNRDNKELIAAAKAQEAALSQKPADKTAEVANPPAAEPTGQTRKVTLNEILAAKVAIQRHRSESAEVIKDFVPTHLTAAGKVVDKSLSGKESLEEICDWCRENVPTGAPCGGGYFEIEDGKIYNDDSEGGHELNLTIAKWKDGLELTVNKNEPKFLPFPIKASEILDAIDPELKEFVGYDEPRPEIHIYDVEYRDRHIPAKAGATFLHGQNVWVVIGQGPKTLEAYEAPRPAIPEELLLISVQNKRNDELSRKLLKLLHEEGIPEETGSYCARSNPGFLKELLDKRRDLPRTEDLLSTLVQNVRPGTTAAFRAVEPLVKRPTKEQATELLYQAADIYKNYSNGFESQPDHDIAVERQNLGRYLMAELDADPKEAMKMGEAGDEWKEEDTEDMHDFDGYYAEFLQDMIDISEGKPGIQFPPYTPKKDKGDEMAMAV